MKGHEIREMAADIRARDDKKKGKLERIHIEPADNGHVVTAHYHYEPKGKEDFGHHEEKRHVFQNADEAGEHVKQLLNEGDLP